MCSKEGCKDINLEMKVKLYEEYHTLTYDEQSLYLTKSMEIGEPARRKKGKTDATSRKHATFTYKVQSKEVCQKTLLDIFSITQRRIQTLQHKLKDGITTPKDGRGKHSNRPHAISDDDRIKIREHISSFPKQISHYSRNNSTKECLSSELNLCKMYRLFKEKFPEKSISRSCYQSVFNTDFNLRFGAPRSDTCRQCDLFFIQMTAASDETELHKIELESQLHHAKADQAYKALKHDTEMAKVNNNVHVICVDLQQVLVCPTLTHSTVFYQRQLSSYNFTIHDVGTGHITVNLWNESIARRGSAEIASCLLKFVTSNYNVLEEGEERKLIVWSDRCVGQNNNWRVLALYFYLINCKYFTEIHQKFLCSGHSFLPCDRDFAMIEKRKKVSKVMVPSEWKYVIVEAFVDPSKLTIHEMMMEDFKDISCIELVLKKPPALKITDVLWLRLCSDDPRGVSVRRSHNVLRQWEQHCIVKRGGEREAHILPLPSDFQLLYNEQLKITKEKKRDLLDMIQYMEPKYRSFYENLQCDN